MVDQIKKDIFISQELRYLNLTNIFFDAPIKQEDIENLKEVFFSINNVNQIYFRKAIDIQSIEVVKYFLEISPTMEDASVEKYIVDVDNKLEPLENINFFNPQTWYIQSPYEKNNLIRLDKYKETKKQLSKVLSNIINSEYSIIEQIAKIYDYCKSIRLNPDSNNDILEVLKSRVSNMSGYSKILSILLKEIGINCYIGEAISDNNKSNVVIADIKDEKYGICGIYLFDVLSDYIEQKDVPDETIKLLNYNFFAITLNSFTKTVFNDRLLGVLNTLSHELSYDIEKVRFVKQQEIREVEKRFSMNYLEIHKKIEQTPEIKDDVKFEILSSINDEKYSSIIIKNYKNRKNKLYNYDI